LYLPLYLPPHSTVAFLSLSHKWVRAESQVGEESLGQQRRRTGVTGNRNDQLDGVTIPYSWILR
jgi:hypothetical protein